MDKSIETPRVGVFFYDAQAVEAFTQAFSRYGVDTAFTITPTATVFEAIDNMPATLTKGVVIADLSKEADQLATCRKLVARLGNRVDVVVLGNDNALDVYRSFRKGGAKDYWAKPVNCEEVVALACESLRTEAEKDGDRKSMLLVDTAYGVGAGLFSSAVANTLSMGGKKTVLVDADWRHPNCGAYVGVDHEGNLPLLLEAGDRIDNTLLGQAVTNVNQTLHLLDGYSTTAGFMQKAAFANLEKRLKRIYARQVWRISGALPLDSVPFADTDAIVAVVTGSMSSLKGAVALRNHLKAEKVQVPVVWVYNQRDAVSSIPVETLEKHLGVTFNVKVDHVKKLNELVVDADRFREDSHPVRSAAAEILAQAGQAAGGAVEVSGKAWWSKLWK